MQNRDRFFYQYALMNLAVLQADFGCHNEAISAMLETVTTARENKDMTCLNFALNWLYNYGQAHPDLVRELESSSLLGTGKESLTYLRVKARDTGMWTLWSSALLGEAKLALIKGDSVAKSWEYLVRASRVIIEKNMKTMFGSQLSMSSALWDRLGLSRLANLDCEIFLRCYATHAIFDDELKLTCRAAILLLSRGKYDEALDKMDSLQGNSLRSWKPNQHWHKYRGVIRLRRILHHNDLDGAEQLLSQIVQSKMDDLDPEMAFVFDTLEIDYLTRRGDLQAAFAKVDELMAGLQDEKKDVACRARLLLLKASLLVRCGRPQRAFTTVMRAASIAWRARLMPSLWNAIGAIANILISLGEFEAAAHLLQSVIPRSLECDGLVLTAQLYVYLGDAYMGLAGQQEPRSARRKELMTKALGAVQKAFDHYSTLEDIQEQCQLMAKKAMIMKVTGNMESAGDYAAKYVELRQKAEAYRQGG